MTGILGMFCREGGMRGGGGSGSSVNIHVTVSHTRLGEVLTCVH